MIPFWRLGLAVDPLCLLVDQSITIFRWGLRVTPIMGALAVLAIIFLMTDPPRGKADGSHLKPTSPLRNSVEKRLKSLFT